MATEAQRKAIRKYKKTAQGKEAQKKALKKYALSEKGREARARASEKFERENAEARREYKRLKQREYRARKTAELAAI